jgi:hypothetical protein
VYLAICSLGLLLSNGIGVLNFDQASGSALLLFTFLMIADPKTTPDRRSDRILFAVLVATAAAWLQSAHFMLRRSCTRCSLPLRCLFPRDQPEVRFEWSRTVLNRWRKRHGYPVQTIARCGRAVEHCAARG